MNKAEDFLLDVLAIMPVRVSPDEDSIIQDANQREQLMSGFFDCDDLDTESILHH